MKVFILTENGNPIKASFNRERMVESMVDAISADMQTEDERSTDENAYAIVPMELENIKVAVELAGGLVQNVFATVPMTVEVCVEDDEETGAAAEETIKKVENDPTWARVW